MIAAAFRLFIYLLFSFVGMPFQFAFLRFAPSVAKRFPVWYHRQCLKLFGIRVELVGTPTAKAPCLFVSNHSSYLDIPVLGSLLPISFVAKREVADWPLYGWLAKLQRTLFIDRRSTQVKKGQTDLALRLAAGDSLVLFPEGTSSDGARVLPFKPALFQPILDQAAGQSLTVQPVTVVCTGLEHLPADRVARQQYAWFGDMDLLPHLWAFCQLGSCVVRVVFHTPVELDEHTDRKTLAAALERTVASGLYRAAA